MIMIELMDFPNEHFEGVIRVPFIAVQITYDTIRLTNPDNNCPEGWAKMDGEEILVLGREARWIPTEAFRKLAMLTYKDFTDVIISR